MKCDRCQKDSSVLTPSPDGDQNLCEECYSVIFHQKLGYKRSHTGALVGGILTALAVLGLVYFLFLRPADEDGDGNQTSTSKTSTTTKKPANPAPPRKKPVFGKNRPRTTPKRSPPKTNTTNTDTNNTGNTDSTNPPNEADDQNTIPTMIDADGFSMTFQSAKQLTQASVDYQGPDGVQAITINAQDTALYEVTVSLTPKVPDEVILEAVAIGLGEDEFIPIQAKIPGTNYQSNSEEIIELMENAQLVFQYEAQADQVDIQSSSNGIERITFNSTQPAATIKLTLLFALPKEFVKTGALFVGDYALKVKL